MARMASRFSVIDTGNPAARSSCTNPWSRSSRVGRGAGPRCGTSVALTFDRAAGARSGTCSSLRALVMSDWYFNNTCKVSPITCGSIVRRAEVEQRARPVDGLGDRRRLLQLERADRAHDTRDLLGQRGVDLGHPHPDDRLPRVEIGIVDVQVETPPLQRLRELTRVVRREQHDRALLADDGAELGDRHLEVGEHLEQQRLGLDLDAVDLVDQQHDGLVGADRLEQRTGQEERLREDVGFDIGPIRLVLTVGLDAQQLLLVVPLVQRLGLVEALVALQSDEARRR